MKRRDVIGLLPSLAFFSGLGSPTTAFASQPDIKLPSVVKIIVPYSAGGSNDVFGRALAQKLSAIIKTNVVVENKPGAGGATAASMVAASPGDGSHLLIGSNSMVMNAVIQTHPQYDPVSSFKTISILNMGPSLILVGKNSKYHDLKSLFEGMKKGEVQNYGSAGIGSAAHLITEMLNRELNSSVQHVPYRGITNALTDMIAGNVDLVIATPASSNGQIKAGYVKGLGITSLKPSPFYPDLPTFSEFLPNFEAESWWGIFATAKTPAPLVEYLNKAIVAACQDQFMLDVFKREGTVPAGMNMQEAGSFVASEKDRWGKVATSRNIRSEA